MLVCNGNGGDRSMRAELAAALNRMGLSVLLFDYRGYGGNPGRRPRTAAADARAAQAWLAAQPRRQGSDRLLRRIAGRGGGDRTGGAAAAGGIGVAVAVHVAGRRGRGALPVAASAAAAARPVPVDRAHRLGITRRCW